MQLGVEGSGGELCVHAGLLAHWADWVGALELQGDAAGSSTAAWVLTDQPASIVFCEAFPN